MDMATATSDAAHHERSCNLRQGDNPLLQSVEEAAVSNISARAGKLFVQAVIWRSIVDSNSMLARETAYVGFGITRSFARSFFGNINILSDFEPLNGAYTFYDGEVDRRTIARLNLVAQIVTRTELKEYGFWRGDSIRSISFTYEELLKRASFDRFKDQSPDWLREIESGIRILIQIMNRELEGCEPRIHDMLFDNKDEKHRSDSIANLAMVIYEFFECVSNDFGGFEDDSWSSVQGVFGKIYPRFDETKTGFSPLQQAVAIRCIEKIRDNLRGYYPVVLRTLIALVGPMPKDGEPVHLDAFSILRDAIYAELRSLAALYDTDPQKVIERLPPNVSYNRERDSLTHTYRGGSQQVTYLSALKFGEIDLWADRYLQRRLTAEQPDGK